MSQRIINIFLFLLLITFPFYLAYQLYYLDKVAFFCPIEYRQGTIMIRHDSYGSGDFLAERSGSRKHNGIDLWASMFTPVYAVRGGKVIAAKFHKGLGNYVELLHPGGYVTIYGHLSRLGVRENQIVRQAEIIGEVGKSGNAGYRGVIPHLHFEIWLKGALLNPMEFLE